MLHLPLAKPLRTEAGREGNYVQRLEVTPTLETRNSMGEKRVSPCWSAKKETYQRLRRGSAVRRWSCARRSP